MTEENEVPGWATIVAIAGRAHRGPSSVRDYFTGARRSHSTTVAAIEVALRELGLEHLRRAQ